MDVAVFFTAQQVWNKKAAAVLSQGHVCSSKKQVNKNLRDLDKLDIKDQVFAS